MLDAFATIDLKIYNCDLAYPFINYYSHKMKNYVEKCGPGRFLHYFLRGGSLLAINKMLELGYQFTSTNEDNESPYLALCDLDPIHCSIRNSKVNEQRFTEGAYSHITRENVSVYKYYKSWLGNLECSYLPDFLLSTKFSIEEYLRNILDKLFKLNINPSFEDCFYIIENGNVSSLLIKYILEEDEQKNFFTEEQRIAIFYKILSKSTSYINYTKDCLAILLKLIPDLLKKLDKTKNNCMHIIASRDTGSHFFIDYLVTYIRKIYLTHADALLVNLVNAQNNDDHDPLEIANAKPTPNTKVIEQFNTWKQLGNIITQLPPLPPQQDQRVMTPPLRFGLFPPAPPASEVRPAKIITSEEITNEIIQNNFEKFKQLIAEINHDLLLQPNYGYALLAKSIALAKSDFINELLSKGCNKFLSANNLYSTALFTLSPDKDISSLLALAQLTTDNQMNEESSNNQYKGTKRPREP